MGESPSCSFPAARPRDLDAPAGELCGARGEGALHPVRGIATPVASDCRGASA